MSEQAKHTPGPWRVSPPIEPCEGPTYWVIVRDRSSFAEFTNAANAVAKCEELNKLEAVRDAAPELLAACKVVLQEFVERDNLFDKTLQPILLAAIEKAEPAK